MKKKYQAPIVNAIDINNEATILSVSLPMSETETGTQLSLRRENDNEFDDADED